MLNELKLTIYELCVWCSSQIDRTCVGDSTCSPESLRVAAYLGLLSQIMAVSVYKGGKTFLK